MYDKRHGLGNIWWTPATDQVGTLKWTITQIWEDAVTLSRVFPGTCAEMGWQIEYKGEIIDCKDSISVTKEHLSRCTFIDDPFPGYITKLFSDAHHFAKKFKDA